MIAKKNLLILAIFALFISFTTTLHAQDDEDEDYYAKLLVKEVEVENPVYKPVISLGSGIIHFLGDIKNPGNNPLLGYPGYRINVSTFFGKDNYFKLNFFVMYGTLQGHDFGISRAMQSDPSILSLDPDLNPIFHNSSFKTDFFEFGGSIEYSFGHWMGKTKRFRPYLSLGASPMIIIRPQTNEKAPNGSYYHFWNDGTIRNIAESHPDSWNAHIMKFDDDYDRNFSQANYHDLGPLKQPSFVIPFEVGFDLYLSYRVNLRVATSLHYILSDMVDNYSPSVAKRYGLSGGGGNDMFLFTNFSLNFDLFSDPEKMKVEQQFAELTDFDYDVMFADQDVDGVFDRLDECPDTPLGAQVDSLGCPFDSDGDGIPDVIDNESNTPQGTIVDEKGVQIQPDVLAQMFEKPTAVRRDEVRAIPVAPIWTRNISFTPGVVPQKFRMVDKDGDGYISFQELLTAIEKFFDGSLNLSVEEIYELNNFFFAQ